MNAAQTVNESEARRIASEWHSGQASGLYAFASSGYVSVEALMEAEREREFLNSAENVAAVDTLIGYLKAHGAEDVCPNCDGDGTVIGYGPTDTCQPCRGNGWARNL